MSLFDRHVEFLAALRTAGLTVSVAEDIDASRALGLVDLLDREQLRATYAASLVKRQVHRPAFDTVFDLYFPPRTGGDVPAGDADRAPRPMRDDPDLMDFRQRLLEALAGDAPLGPLAAEGVSRFGSVRAGQGGGRSWSRHAALNRISAPTLMADLLRQALGDDPPDAVTQRAARTRFTGRIAQFEALVGGEVQRRLAERTDAADVARHAVRPGVDQLDLQSATRADLAAIRREIQPLARRMAARLAIEQRRGRRGALDFRRTIRASLSSGGHAVDTVHRPRRPRRTDLVVICDVSDSVSSFARFTLLLVYALRQQFTRVRVFAFVDELDEVTELIDPTRDVDEAVASLGRSARVRGWSGRTDYGRAFGLFAERHVDAVTPRTSLLILGDARSNYGDLALPALQRMVAAARRSYWLNPERRASWNLGDSAADEVGALVPMVECRTLRQLAAFVAGLV